MGFFSLNTITRHHVNSSQFHELPHSVVTTQGQAGQNGNSPSASCAERRAKVQRSVCFHQRHFHPRAGLQVPLRLWESQTPQLSTTSPWGSIQDRVSTACSSHCANMLSPPPSSLLQLRCPLSPAQLKGAAKGLEVWLSMGSASLVCMKPWVQSPAQTTGGGTSSRDIWRQPVGRCLHLKKKRVKSLCCVDAQEGGSSYQISLNEAKDCILCITKEEPGHMAAVA